MGRCCRTVQLSAAAAGLRRGISALLYGACKLFARKCYPRLPKGAAAFLPSAAIACSKPVFVIDAASALMLCTAIIQLISAAVFLLQLLCVLRMPWKPVEGFAAVSPLVALLTPRSRQPPILPLCLRRGASWMPAGAATGEQLLVKAPGCPGARGGVLGCMYLRQSKSVCRRFARLLENSH